MLNAFTVDVEDYFHPTELRGGSTRWPSFAPRVHIGVDFLLDALADAGVKGSFFCLGWVAEHHPSVIRAIAEAGHEIGCHSYEHNLVYDLSPAEFKTDTLRAVRAIEDACGQIPRIYRAPSYSVITKSLWALEVLVECGFTHDSSVYPIVHDRYGIPGFPRYAHRVMTASGSIVEIPIATAQLGLGRIAPVGGGAYLRLFPYRYTAAGIRKINCDENQPACMYIHPWEVDPDQPRLASTLLSRMRTYTGLTTVRLKIKRLLRDFNFSTLTAVYPADAFAVEHERRDAREAVAAAASAGG